MDGIHLLANAQGVCSRPNPGPPLWGQACIPALSVGVRPAFVLLGSGLHSCVEQGMHECRPDPSGLSGSRGGLDGFSGRRFG
jgi:hypothetical protein